MRIIDRYFLLEFVKVYLICFLSLFGLFLVFHAFSNLDHFLETADSSQEMLMLMGEFYFYRLILLFEQAGNVVTLIAAMFTFTWFQRNNEMVALWAAGISNWRLIIPLVIAGAVISLSASTVRETVIPAYKRELSRTPKDLKGDSSQELQPRYDRQTGILIQGHSTFANDQRIKLPNFILPSALAGRSLVLVAENAFYRPPTDSRPGGYLLENVKEPKGFCEGRSLSVAGKNGSQPVVITAADADWLRANECFVVSKLSFQQLVAGDTWRKYSSTPELVQALHNPSFDFGADVRVAIHARLLQPVLDVTLLFLGIPFVLGSENRNVFVSVGICAAIAGTFLVVTYGCQSLGAVGLIAPVTAAWLPALLFIPLATILSEPLWK